MENLFNSLYLNLPYFETDFEFPSGLVFDSLGTLYITDRVKHCVFKAFPSGKVIKFVGSGTPGLKDGNSLSAQFNTPYRIAADSYNNLYLADYVNSAIRKITIDGRVSTIISGDKANEILTLDFYKSSNTIFFSRRTAICRVFSNSSGYEVWAGSLSQPGNVDAYALNARFQGVFGMAVDQSSGALYLADTVNNAIRKIDPDRKVSTIIRNLNYPIGIVMLRNESVVFSELYGHRIQKYQLENGITKILAGNGAAGSFDGLGTDSVVIYPSYLTYNPLTEEIVFIENSSVVRVINKFNYVSTLFMPKGAGYTDGKSFNARFGYVLRISVDNANGAIYVLDEINNAIRKVSTLTGETTTVLGKPYPGNVVGNLSDALLSSPKGISYFENSLFITDFGNKFIKRVHLPTENIENFLYSSGASIVRVDKYEPSIYIRNIAAGSAIEKYNFNGILEAKIGSGSAGCRDGEMSYAQVNSLGDIVITKNKSLYFTDLLCRNIRKFDPISKLVTTIAGQSEQKGYLDGQGSKALFSYPLGIAYHEGEDAFYIADIDINIIRKLLPNGTVSTHAGSLTSGYRNGPINRALFNRPNFVDISSDGDILITDQANFAIRKISREGLVTTLSGYGSQKYNSNATVFDLNCPSGISSKGDFLLFIVNREDNNIVKFDLKSRNVTLVAGNGEIGWMDGETFTSTFNRPEDVHYSPNCDCLFIADTRNHLIRKVTISGKTSTFSGTGNRGSLNSNLLSSEFNLPTSVTEDIDGNLYVSDSNNHVIRKISISSGKVSTYSGMPGQCDLVDGKLSSARFNVPFGIKFDSISGNLILSDMYNHAIRSINATNVITLAGNGTSGYFDGPSREALFSFPQSIGINMNGDIYVSDSANDRIRKLSNGLVSTVGNPLKDPSGLLILNGILYVAESQKHAIKKLDVQIYKTAPIKKDDTSMDHILYICISTFILVASLLLYWNYRRKALVSARLAKIQQTPKVLNKQEITDSITLAQSVIYSIPGYLLLDLAQVLMFESVTGTGATAKVVSATLKDLKLISKHKFDKVVVKFVDESMTLENFNYEVALTTALPKSPNIVEFVGYSVKPMAIVMKSYPLDLSKILNERFDILTEDDKRSIIKGIAQGMVVVHECGIIHFDLKPGNILIDFTEGDLPRSVICDFGFSGFSKDAKSFLVKGIRTPGNVGITARYAAPELFHSKWATSRLEDDIFKKVDVFAFAMITYFVFTGERPWANVNQLGEIESKVCAGERPLFPKPMSSDIQSLIQVCWSQDPKERPSFPEIVNKI